jgi:hypothetical protein
VSQLANQALEACTAATGNVSLCTPSLICPKTPGIGPYVCDGNGGTNCAHCWSYGGTDFGQTQDCTCPPPAPLVIGTWN